MSNQIKNKGNIILIILIAILAIFVFKFEPKIFPLKKVDSKPKILSVQNNPAASTTPSAIQNSTATPISTATPSPTSKSVKSYTMAEVYAKSNDPNTDTCWTVIHGKVYDITEFAATSHPGGEVIFQACGIDATKLFETRPMGSGTPHSAEARKILEKYYIGDLQNN